MATIYAVESRGDLQYFTTKKQAMKEAQEEANASGDEARITKCEFRLSRETFCDALCRGGWADKQTDVAIVKPKNGAEE